MRGVRVALYYAPEPDDPLWAAGCSWLGRDAELAVNVAQPAVPGLPALTAAPRRYGFHATLVAPFRLATGWDEAMAAVEALAARCRSFALPPLEVGRHRGCVSLLAPAPCPALPLLHEAALAALDPHRLQPDQADLARRRLPGLDAAEERNLMRWGYPYVREQFRFHMTLAAGSDDTMLVAAAAHFADALRAPRRLGALCVFTEHAAPGEQAPLLLAERFALSDAGQGVPPLARPRQRPGFI